MRSPSSCGLVWEKLVTDLLLLLRRRERGFLLLLLLALAVGLAFISWLRRRQRLEVVLQIIAFGHKIRDIVAIEETKLKAHDGTDAEDQHYIDQAKLERRLSLLLGLLL